MTCVAGRKGIVSQEAGPASYSIHLFTQTSAEATCQHIDLWFSHKEYACDTIPSGTGGGATFWIGSTFGSVFGYIGWGRKPKYTIYVGNFCNVCQPSLQIQSILRKATSKEILNDDGHSTHYGSMLHNATSATCVDLFSELFYRHYVCSMPYLAR